MPSGSEHDALLAGLPAALRDLMQAEPRAGNTIIEAGAGHPVPPAGGMIKPAGDLRTPLPAGVSAYARS